MRQRQNSEPHHVNDILMNFYDSLWCFVTLSTINYNLAGKRFSIFDACFLWGVETEMSKFSNCGENYWRKVKEEVLKGGD